MGVVRLRPILSSLPRNGSSTGAQAASAWVDERSLGADARMHKHWHVEIALAIGSSPPSATFDDRVDTRFHIDIYSEEWGFFVCHAGRASWIRITDIAFVHGRDDFHLLGQTPPLAQVGTLLRAVEREHSIAFQRQLALVRTNLAGGEAAIRRWVESL